MATQAGSRPSLILGHRGGASWQKSFSNLFFPMVSVEPVWVEVLGLKD